MSGVDGEQLDIEGMDNSSMLHSLVSPKQLELLPRVARGTQAPPILGWPFIVPNARSVCVMLIYMGDIDRQKYVVAKRSIHCKTEVTVLK